ncbi:MAG: sulfotransferase [Desulfovibrio sp.]|jgi:hypothetical protein|nr:sulfotransferase [Desulfovibrio sp.]
MPDPKCILILGMHRGGTSAVSRSLRIFGASHGDDLVGGLSSNPLGHWEDIDVLRLDDAMLEALGMRWDSLEAVTERDVQILERQGFHIKASQLLADKIKANRFYALKEPRMTKLLPFWNKILAPLRPHCVIVFRNPASVAESLYKRDRLPPERGYLLWAVHMLECFRYAGEDTHLLVNYDDFMDDAEAALRRIARFFSLPVIADELNLVLNGFLHQNLRHTRYDARHLRGNPACPEQIGLMYEDMECLSRRGRHRRGCFAEFHDTWRRRTAALLPG